MAKYVVAVSGGVDSIVLLDMLQRVGTHELIVAHFDHGIRVDSANDALFVANVAKDYGLLFETCREELGEHVGEEYARERRYAFLREVAKKHNATIITAHHADDTVETIAINLKRGTGWRGLTPLDSLDIVRPLIHTPKATLKDYAIEHGLTWHEDSTNTSDAYLRNRIRKVIDRLTADERQQLLALRAQQLAHKKLIDKEVSRLVGPGPNYSRYFFTHTPSSVALECLRFVTQSRLTRPQLERSLLAIKTAAVGTVFEAGQGVNLRFTSRNFSL